MKPLEDEEDDKLSQFETFNNTSVLTKRNFSLYRGRSIVDAVDVLHLANSTETAGRSSGDESDEPAAAEIPQAKNFYVWNKNPQVNGPQFKLTYGDKSSSKWFWPLSNVRIINTDTSFEVRLCFKPFKSSEITAVVVGSDLMLRCKSDEEHHVSDSKEPHRHTCSREIIRCYQLPLNAITSTVKFLLLEQKQTLIVKCDKERPIKLAVA